MRRRFGCAALAASALLGTGLTATEPTIRGRYVEARTSDVFTGPCVANSEVNLQGKQAMLAWTVAAGDWDGVRLDGLSVVAALRASATLGDPHAAPQPVRSVLLVDERASAAQQRSLVALARRLAGELLGETVTVERVPITAQFDLAGGETRIVAGSVAEIRTRPLCHHDRHCGNEHVYYPPLTPLDTSEPAFALANVYRGPGLDGRWSSPDRRSAFVGTFVR